MGLFNFFKKGKKHAGFKIGKSNNLVTYKGKAPFVVIPDSVETIDSYAFKYCRHITAVVIPGL